MLIWLSLVVFLIIFYLVCKSTIKNEKKANRAFLIVSFLVLTVVLGSRDINHAFSDEPAYYNVYRNIVKMDFDQFLDHYRGTKEIGYFLVNFLLSRVFTDPQTIIYFVTGVAIGSTFLFIYKFCKYPLMSILLYFGIGLMTFEMTAFRQTCAISIVLLASMKLYDNKRIQAFLLIIFATFFHTTSILGLLLFLVPKEEFSIKQLVLYFLLLIIFLFGQELLDLGREVFEKNYGLNDTIGILGYVIQIIIIFAPYVAINLIDFQQHKLQKAILYYSNRTTLTAGVIYLARIINRSFERISFYFSPYILVSYNCLIEKCSTEKDKTIVKFVISVLSIGLFLYRMSNADIQFNLFT